MSLCSHFIKKIVLSFCSLKCEGLDPEAQSDIQLAYKSTLFFCLKACETELMTSLWLQSISLEPSLRKSAL